MLCRSMEVYGMLMMYHYLVIQNACIKNDDHSLV